MRYEKRLMILSGRGKGVVMIEKSGLGVKFALRTFGLAPRGDYHIGVITPSTVTVRDLPATADPQFVFYIDDVGLDGLHFAVFTDSALVLYGSTGVRMWEANVMDILRKHSMPAALDTVAPAPALPPLSTPPKVLPLPDGTGIPQSRDVIYGDDAIAAADFYTTVDLDSHMPRIDSFLDAPRALDVRNAARLAAETTAVADIEPEPDIDERDVEEETGGAFAVLPNPSVPISATAATVEAPDVLTVADDGRVVEMETSMEESNTEQPSAATENIESEEQAAADVSVAPAEKPWEMTARWLKTRSKRPLAPERRKAPPIPDTTAIPRLRELAFFERNGADIEKLFSSGQRDGELTALLPDIEWVKIPVDGRHSISVGRSGSAFLCYAVAGSYERIPPIENAQWLPKLRTAPTGKGYWLVFQDLGNGNIIV